MLIDGLTLTEGSDARNLTIFSDVVFPKNPSPAELFHHDDSLYCYLGGVWKKLNQTQSSAGSGAFDPLAGPDSVNILYDDQNRVSSVASVYGEETLTQTIGYTDDLVTIVSSTYASATVIETMQYDDQGRISQIVRS